MTRRVRIILGVVGGILALLIGLLFVLLFVLFFDMRTDKCRSGIGKSRCYVASLHTTLDLYYAEHGSYPDQSSWRRALTEKGPDGQCLLKGCKMPRDPWGGDYYYRYPGRKNPEGFDVCSMGPDRQPDTDDDICDGDER